MGEATPFYSTLTWADIKAGTPPVTHVSRAGKTLRAWRGEVSRARIEYGRELANVASSSVRRKLVLF